MLTNNISTINLNIHQLISVTSPVAELGTLHAPPDKTKNISKQLMVRAR